MYSFLKQDFKILTFFLSLENNTEDIWKKKKNWIGHKTTMNFFNWYLRLLKSLFDLKVKRLKNFDHA